ncbi:hypothetical protein, partial [Nodularia spumigena]|uniref:hypothetical protein n=1 Tax=Nodularia spumigena TaxID=70799 RepID=UPI0030DC5D86
ADYFIWLNDDTFPLSGTIEGLIQACQSKSCLKIVSAQCYASNELILPTYGAHRAIGANKINLIPAYTTTDEIMVGDAVSGNLVCLPRSVIQDIGYPPAHQCPQYGDVIYTWKAKQWGYDIQAYGAYKAICAPNEQQLKSWLVGEDSIWSIWRSFSSPKSYFYFKFHWYCCMTFYGWLGIFVFIRPYWQLCRNAILRWLFPKSFLIYLQNRRDEFKEVKEITGNIQ